MAKENKTRALKKKEENCICPFLSTALSIQQHMLSLVHCWPVLLKLASVSGQDAAWLHEDEVGIFVSEVALAVDSEEVGIVMKNKELIKREE